MSVFPIYFPQFYPIPTNDLAWGKGFTDWCLIAHANMLDEWRRRAPARGLYDGADPRLHVDHMLEARASGLGGFAVYHYWFYTHQELDAFERTLLSSSDPERSIPWFLIWASEGWYRRWLGDARTLVELPDEPTGDQIERHCDYLAQCFSHPFYFRWNGRPLFVWYHLAHFRNPEALLERYSAALRRRGFAPSFAHFLKNPADATLSRLVEATYLFEPRLFFASQGLGHGLGARWLLDTTRRALGGAVARRLLILRDRMQQRGALYSAAEFERYMMSEQRRAFRSSLPGEVQEVLTPGWNNAPRYGRRSTCLQDLPPPLFGALARKAAASGLPALVNAWNEWSEGAAIEPCAYLSSRYLDALREPPG